MKIQPLDTDYENLREPVLPASAKPVLRSRLRKLFDRQFRISSAEKPITIAVEPSPQQLFNKYGRETEFEPSSVCLAKMVQNFMEESNDRQPAPAKYGRNRCICFNANSNDSSDDEIDFFGSFGDTNSSVSYGSDSSDILKLQVLIPCVSVVEGNILADTAKIIAKSNTQKHKDDLIKIVTEGLSSLGYDSSICKSKWDKSPSFPAGEYEYIDVIEEGNRIIIDIDFRSEFEIARSTGTYKAILQSLPYIFVGKSGRLGQIVSIISEAARRSLKKKGMHVPPWRKAEYMRGKWLSPHSRITQSHKYDAVSEPKQHLKEEEEEEDNDQSQDDSLSDCGDLELIFGEETTTSDKESSGDGNSSSPVTETSNEVIPLWIPLAIKQKSVERGTKIVTGLAYLLKEKQ